MTNHEGHIKLWDELARTGSDDKYGTYDRLFPNNGTTEADAAACFACQEVSDRQKKGKKTRSCIKMCPIQWKGKGCLGFGAEYKRWTLCDDPEERKHLAAIIRDLPWREE
jgi:hypothetical protein